MNSTIHTASPAVRGFRPTFTVIGVVYTLMATWTLVRGEAFLLDFGVSPAVVAEPVLVDFFSFFYQLMAFIGVLMVVLGQVVTERWAQIVTAATFGLANVLFALRDLGTSDSPFGNHLYAGSETLVFVAIDVALALAFGALVLRGALPPSPASASAGDRRARR